METISMGRAGAALRPWWVAAGATGLIELANDMTRALVFAPGVGLSTTSTLTLLCGHLIVPLLALLLLGLGWAAGRASARVTSRGWVATIAVPAVVLGVLLAWPLWRAGVGLASGAWISEQSFAPIVRVAPLVGGLVGSPILAAIALNGAKTLGWRHRALVLGLFGVTLVMIFADHRVAPGLYPEFHMIAYATGSSAMLLAIRRLLDSHEALLSRSWARSIAIGLAVTLASAPVVWFRASSRVRSELLLYSPVARDWIRTVMPQRKSTPLRAILEDLDVSTGAMADADVEAPRGLIPEARDMNVLFIVVDAMRADAIAPVRPADGTPFAHPGDTPFLDEWVAGAFRFSRCYAGATVTHLSMPSMMRSIQPFEDSLTKGEALGSRLEALGFSPLAVVVEYFLAAKYPEATALLDGFNDVAVYEKKDNNTLVPSARELLERSKGQRFFAWLHFYNLHDPGFDGALLSTRDGSRVQRYRSSLRWLDGQMRELVATLDQLGLRDNTIIVLAADHGEGLGDHGQSLHGPTVFEHDVRVPLAIEIPGRAGVQIDAVVGNIDLVPTIVDLIGGPAGPEDRGSSLVPEMAAAAGMWTPPSDELAAREYFFRNRAGDTVGVVHGADKLVLEREIDVAYRFDVVEDREEHRNLHDPESDIDRDLMRRLIVFDPRLVADELEDETTVDLLAQRLDEVDPQNPGSSLAFLLRVAALHPTKATTKAALRIFDDSDDVAVRLLILRHGFSMARKAFEQRVNKWLTKLAGTDAELEIVAALARQGQPSVGGKTILDRLTHWSRSGGPQEWEPYLMLVRPWRKSAQYFADPFSDMLQRAQEIETPPRVLELLLTNVASTRVDSNSTSAALGASCRPLLRHDDPRVRVAALRAVSSLEDDASLPQIRETLATKGEDIRVRREAASALAAIAATGAVPDLVAVGEDPGLSMVVVRRLGSIGSADALPFLTKVKDTHYNRFLRRAAEEAISGIRGSKRTPKRKKKKPPAP